MGWGDGKYGEAFYRANAYSDILAVRPALEYLIAKISAFYRLLIVELLIPSLALN